jgi:hypothetical protein
MEDESMSALGINTQKGEFSQTEQKLESMSTLVLILKKESFLYYIRQEAAFNRS